MALVRRHLRRGVVAWLVCHALTFAALIPRDCCAAHGHAVAAAGEAEAEAEDQHGAPPCHEAADAPAPGAHCEMAAAEGAACPMHRTASAPLDCQMSGLCGAPEAALAAVVLQAAVLVGATPALPAGPTEPAPWPPDLSAHSLTAPPDAPPPRL